MVPVQIAASEAYEGLQRGVIDCLTHNLPTMMQLGWWDTAKYVDRGGFSSVPGSFVLNDDIWESLPEDARKVVQDGVFKAWIAWNDIYLTDYARMVTEGAAEQD